MSTFDDMVGFVKTAWPARRFIVPCLEGPAGIGKTAAIRQAAEELKDQGEATGKVVTIIASQILPNEVSGITMPVAETKAMEIFDHFRLGNLEDGDILFFDELLEADQLVLSACLTLIESRELMSGRKLPDCMVVAATNPTIKPSMLKENIRQRFVWRKFELDQQGCRDYIKKECGFDIGMELAGAIRCSGDEYNILSPRSMTKMAMWMSKAKDKEEAATIARQIDAAWSSALGSKLCNQFLKLANDPMSQVKRTIRYALDESGIKPVTIYAMSEGCGEFVYGNDDDVNAHFEESSITEVMETLKILPEWEEISKRLASTMLEKQEDVEVSF